MRGLLSETVNHKLSAEGIILWVPTLVNRMLCNNGRWCVISAQHQLDKNAILLARANVQLAFWRHSFSQFQLGGEGTWLAECELGKS
jgi:hypothetical protein